MTCRDVISGMARWFALIFFMASVAWGDPYIAFEIHRTRVGSENEAHRVYVRFCGLRTLSGYEKLTSARLCPPAGGELEMINRESSRSFELSRYVPFNDYGEVAGSWQIKLYASGKIVDTLHFEVEHVSRYEFPPFPFFPKRSADGDPSLVVQQNTGYPPGSYYGSEDTADSVLLSDSAADNLVWRIPTNTLTRFCFTHRKDREPMEVLGQNGEPKKIEGLLWLVTEVVVWFFPPPATVVDPSAAAADPVRAVERTEPQIMVMKEDEIGFPLVLMCAGLNAATPYALEISTDLKVWKLLRAIAAGEGESAITLECNEPIAFFRISRMPGPAD